MVEAKSPIRSLLVVSLCRLFCMRRELLVTSSRGPDGFRIVGMPARAPSAHVCTCSGGLVVQCSRPLLSRGLSMADSQISVAISLSRTSYCAGHFCRDILHCNSPPPAGVVAIYPYEFLVDLSESFYSWALFFSSTASCSGRALSLYGSYCFFLSPLIYYSRHAVVMHTSPLPSVTSGA